MKPLRQRDLVHDVRLVRLIETRKETGGRAATWTDTGGFWAEVTALDGREALIERVMQGIRHIRVRTWFGTVADAKDRLIHDGATFNIRSVADPDGRRRELVIIADTGETA